MKKIAFALLLLTACNSRNSLMTDLVNKKKQKEDSINVYKNDIVYFDGLSHNEKDTVKSKQFLDSSIFSEINMDRVKEELKAVQFSIDSLEKMK